jgi:hypothetical protein
LNCRLTDLCEAALAERGKRAELIPAQAEGLAFRFNGAGQFLTEAGQQGIADGVTEGVVVALEAVQVEQQKRPRRALRGRLKDILEADQKPAAVAERGERVGQRLVAALIDQRQVL